MSITDLGITGAEISDFLRQNGLDPRRQPFLSAEAVASYFGLPIHSAHQMVQDL